MCGVTGGFWEQRLRTNRERLDPARVSSSSTRPGTSRTSPWRRAPTAAIARSARTIGVIFPFLDTDLYKWLEAAAWELGRGAGSCACARCRPGDRPGGGGAAPGRLPQHLRPGRRTRQRVQGSRLGSRALLRRSPDPGGRRLAARARRRPAPRGRHPGRRFRRPRARPDRPPGDRRSPRDRDGARRAVPDHRRTPLPRARGADHRSARRRAARDRTLRPGLLAGPRPGARCDDGGRSRGSPAVPRLWRRGCRHRAG